MTVDSTTFDSVLDLCQHQHRRIVLGRLAAEQQALNLDNLAMTILKYNHPTPLKKTFQDAKAGINLSLTHVHLPKLAATGLITYDPEKEFVEPTEQFEQMRPILSSILAADPQLETPMVA
jgi:hypothetical protein